MNPCEVLLDVPVQGAGVLVEYDSTIAVIEPDETVRNFLCDCLRHAGFRVWSESSAEGFCLRLLRETADLVIMAAGQAGSFSISLTERLVADGVPVIVLDMPCEDRESFFPRRNSGEALHLTKPVKVGAVMAAVDTLRGYWKAPSTTPRLSGSPDTPWRFDGARRCLISPYTDVVPLTSRETALMRCLAVEPGSLVSKHAVAEAMGVAQAEGGFHRIEANLCRLRKKVKQLTGLSMPVNSVFGEGLIFTP